MDVTRCIQCGTALVGPECLWCGAIDEPSTECPACGQPDCPLDHASEAAEALGDDDLPDWEDLARTKADVGPHGGAEWDGPSRWLL